jgi:hypothetical protein
MINDKYMVWFFLYSISKSYVYYYVLEDKEYD